MEQLAPGRGAVGAAYWNDAGRARRFAAAVGTGEEDPLHARLRRASGPRSTVIDVGAGTGRFALALAPRVHEVVAVDASRTMLAMLGRTARARGIANVRCLERRWEDVTLAPCLPDGLAPADVVLASYVVTLIPEAEAFLAKMHIACRGRAFVTMNAWSADAVVDPFWRHFHGAPRRPAPTYLDLLAILGDLGLKPEVEVVEVSNSARFATVAAAAKSYRDTLVLPDTAEVRAELRGLLTPWLVGDAGALRPPVPTTATAIVSWPAMRA